MSDETAVPLEELDFYAYYADPFWWGYVRHGHAELCETDGHASPLDVTAALLEDLRGLGVGS